MVLFRFDRLPLAYIFGSNPLNMSFFFLLMVLESESFSVSDRTRYRVSYILRLEKQLRVHHVEFFSGTKISHSHRISTFRPTHSQDRDTVGPNIIFRGFSTYFRDPRVQEILVITKPSVMSRFFSYRKQELT